MYIMHNMYLYRVANNISLEYTYSTFKCLENNIYKQKKF